MKGESIFTLSIETKDMTLLGIDAGFGNTKVTFAHEDKEYKIDFPSRVKEVKDENVDVINLNGKLYSFTEGDLIVNNGHLTKDNEETRVLIWKAMYEAHLITKETEFDICMNSALDAYKEDRGKSTQDRMNEFKTIKVKEKFKSEVELKINNIVCMPECLMGGLTANIKLKEEEVVMLDIGTLNIQGIHVIKGVPQYNTTFATPYGMNYIYRQLADLVKVKVPGLSSASAIQMYLEKTAKKEYELLPDVEDIILNYLAETIFKELGIELKNLKMSIFAKLISTGGGCITLKRFLDVNFTERENVFVKQPYWATSKALHSKGKKLFGYEVVS